MERLSILKENLQKKMCQKKEWWGDDLTILDRPGMISKPLPIRKAKAIEKVCSEMPIRIEPAELIVGTPTMSSVGFGNTFPRYETDDEAKEAAKVMLNRKSVWGHNPPYYPKILQRGLSGLKAEALFKLAETPDEEKKIFYESVIISLDAVVKLAHRYADLAERMGKGETNEKRKNELLTIAQICHKVPKYPAESFHEALQSVQFVHIALHSCLNFVPLGRIDQYLWPYLRYDLEKGTITEEKARELLGCFLIKFSERVVLKPEYFEDHFTFGNWSQGGDPNEESTTLIMRNEQDFMYGQSANSFLQNAILGGVTPEGQDATNELTYMILDLMSELHLAHPIISVRLHEKSPEKLLRKSCKLARKGTGMPVFFNDDVIIPGMMRMKIPVEEARDYSNDGCHETLVYGRTEFAYGHVELLPALEHVLNRGKSFVTDKQVGIDTGDPTQFSSFEEFYQAFRRSMEFRIDRVIENKLKHYDYVHKIAPAPLNSAFTEDCMKKGKDITQRGARYTFYAPLITGLSHCADSLAAIKKFVYEEKTLSMGELIKALKDNFDGKEDLRQLLLNKAPKYGNDDEYVDEIAARIVEDFVNHVEKLQERVWLKLAPGIATFENYPRLGFNAGASADGRKSQEAIAPNASPSVGLDRNGLTAVFKSATRYDQTKVHDGAPLDIRLVSNAVKGEDGLRKLMDLVKSYFKLGGNILSINVVDNATLKAAKKEPEKYQDLLVRLGGFSAYFVALAPKQQDEVIKRTEHTV